MRQEDMRKRDEETSGVEMSEEETGDKRTR